MDDQIYLDERYLSIRWRSVPQILYAEWKGYATSAEFRAALLKRGQAIREHHVVGQVSDARKAKVFVTEDLQWVSEVWLPQVVKAGLKRMAMEWMIANDTLCNSQGYATKKTPPQLGILCGFP